MSDKQKVLMIDNAKMMHSVVKARLSEDDVAFHSAFGGQEGLQMAGEIKPDLILLDIEMPAMSGFEVCKRLKADASLSTIPVIFLTGVTSMEEKVRGLNIGAVDYVTKPFDGAELQARVRASLRTKELLDLLSKRAMIDGLTGLRNRAYFDQRLGQELSRAHRLKSPLSCIMADIDHFKSVNDTHGHGFGDMVLRGTAQIIADCCRQEDIPCRYGGEEFIVLSPGVPMAGAVVLAERIRAAIANRSFIRGGACVNVTCSIGVSDLTLGDNLCDTADAALYKAKAGGRNKVVIAETVAKAA